MAMSDLKKIMLVLACFTGQFVSVGIFLSYGPLFAALIHDTGKDSGSIALIGSLRDLLLNIIQAMAGFVVKDIGFVTMSAMGASFLLAGTFLDSFAGRSLHWHFVWFSVFTGAGNALLWVPQTTVLYGRLGKKELPIAVAVASAGGGLGTVAINALFEDWIFRIGWRAAERILALAFALCLSLSLLGLCWALSPSSESRPGASDSCDSSQKPGPPSSSCERSRRGKCAAMLRDLMRPVLEVDFALLNVALLLYFTGFTVPYTHLVFYAREIRGYSGAPTLMSSLGAASIIGRLCCGLLAVFFSASRLFIAMIVLQAGALALLPLCHSAGALHGFAVLFGLSSGTRVALMGLVLNELFGAERVPHLFGLSGLSIGLGQLIGPPLVGFIYETHSHEAAFWTSASLMLLSVPALCAILTRTRRTVEDQPASSDVSEASSDESVG
ncbi:slc16a12 [Symbiodinium sp. KB8]|nr:slc16a12 [Symbiodinium sp. KB8]